MDPNEALRKLLRAIQEQDRDEALEATHDLYTWLEMKGFLPDWKVIREFQD
ncbi:MAG: hypothetical protein GY769_07845 [bacterium]|nr:hypothetical protein [bacterium]